MNNSTSTHGPYSSPLYASQYGEDEEDPWGSIATFDPVADIRQHLTTTNNTTAVDEDILEEGVTAASVLVGVDLPEIFDTAYIRANPIGDRVTLESLERILHLANLAPRTVEQIISLVVPSNALYVTRNEFNSALALTACVQKNMDLPLPILSNLDSVTIPKIISSSVVINDTKPTNKINTNAVVDDPWRTTGSANPPINSTTITNGKPMIQINGTTANPPTLSESKTFTKLDTTDWFTDLDNIKVVVAPEKEGFIFKHINYIVESQHRSSLVLRRYSDFFWLWEVLLKRYPCRLVPNLPPKKISGRDEAFLEARRQGLSLFINCVARHPVLKKDIIFNTFMTEPSEFLAWRRGNPPLLDEEFVRINEHLNTDDIATCIPRDLDDRLEKLEKSLPQKLAYYQSLYDSMDTLVRLERSQVSELERYKSTLNALGDVEQHCYIPGCQACGHVTRGYDAVAKYMHQTGSILEQEANATVSGIMNQLKRHHDTLLAFKDILDRRKKFAAHQIDTLTKRIASNKAKVNQHRGVPGLEADVERLDENIQSDQERLTFQQRRALFIRYCLVCELTFAHKQQAFISVLYQDFVHEKLQYSRHVVDNWKALEVLTCNMPDLQEFE
ncbi:hypothetical protein BC941DRAFT_358857 [Chlamydoabsidia padenii]|nr:hypothetical protein BC941DRAFT_358857 [Chlamydoabsidia padenii]